MAHARVAGVIAAEQERDRASAELVLHDFTQALVAYERLGGFGDGCAQPARFELVRISPNCPAAGHAEPCGALVLAAVLSPHDASRDGHENALVASLEELMGHAEPLLTPNAPVYAIVVCPGTEPGPAYQALEACAAYCAANGLTWCGGVAAAGAHALPRLMHSPRLGALRRPLSEAIDRLILAVRSSCSLAALDEIAPSGMPTHGNIIKVPTHLAQRLFFRFARTR